MQNMKQKVYKNIHKNDKFMAHRMNLYERKQKVSLYTILEIQSQLFSVNEEVQQVYDNIREKRKNKLSDLCTK